jgi:hypothetical protein
MFSLRVVQAHNESKRYSTGLATYMQLSLGLGFISITFDLVSVVRCLLVNATYGPERYPDSPAALSKGGLLTPPPDGTPDLPKVRFWARRLAGLLAVASVVATLLCVFANSCFSKVFDNQKQADVTAKTRFVHCLIPFVFSF